MYSVQMEKRCPDALYVGNIGFKGWRFAFSPKHSGANIFHTGETQDQIWGCLYEITSACEAVLDVCEGVKDDHYEKVHLTHDDYPDSPILIYVVKDCAGQSAPYMDYHSRILKALVLRAMCPEYIKSIADITHLGVNNPKRNYQGDADGRAVKS
tara:strand:+ start:221505 stop:221966 length:462 start_codon:yes stop_codon:yes gene_type:complete